MLRRTVPKKQKYSKTCSKTHEKTKTENAALFTGTGIIVPNDLPLAPDDVVEIEADGLGKLANPVKQL